MNIYKELEREARERQQETLTNMPGLRAYELGYAAGIAEAVRRIQSSNTQEAIRATFAPKPAERSE